MLEERGGQGQQLLGPLTKDITKKLTDATTALAKADKDLKLEIAGVAADAAGLVDPTPTSDLVGAGISIARGDYWGAALSTVSMVPYLGDAVAKPMKAVRATKSLAALQAKVATLTKTVNDLKKAKKEAEALETATKQAKLAKEAQGSSRNKRGSNSAGKDVGQERQRLRRFRRITSPWWHKLPLPKNNLVCDRVRKLSGWRRSPLVRGWSPNSAVSF